MKTLPRFALALLLAAVAWNCPLTSFAQEEKKEAAKESPKPKFPPFATVVGEAKTVDGLIKLHLKGEKLYAEIPTSQLNKDYLVLISIARGISQGPILGGMTWGFGDDWLWQFRKVEDNIHVVRRNTRFKANPGSPESNAVKLAYTDSVLFSLPIATMSPSGAMVVDLTPIFMSDLPQIGRMLQGFMFAQNKSTWASVKGFKDNVEIQVAATYASAGTSNFDTVADSRGVTINVHYSISQLPNTGYKPRMADDRVGYFLTAVKDFSQPDAPDRFARYINRWDLQKADPSAEVSPPKQPIIFWLEKTIPFQYRKPIRDGILEWNKAFEKAGYSNAIEVRQQPDDADWDPEDVNYNTFRWITAGAGFAMGPSRVNPTTGQILDADIIFDADFVSFWKQEHEVFTREGIAAMTGGPLTLEGYRQALERLPSGWHPGSHGRCDLGHGFCEQMAFGSSILAAQHGLAASKPMEEKLIMQGLKEVTMHEVGHTLGLRHNFKASTLYNLADINDPTKTSVTGQSSSVMDYMPANLVPKDVKQGDYYSTTIGPYDMWAIEYGYKPFASGEAEALKKIASRSASPELSFATDEDTRGIDSDPLSNRFDMGKDPLEYCQRQVAMVTQLMPDLVKTSTPDGEGYQRARRAFGLLLSNYGQSMHFASRYVGGLYVNRDHKSDPNGRPPFVVVEAAKQRQALDLLEKQLFNDKPFQFPPELYNHLAATRWSHWGMRDTSRLDYPVHDVIEMWQDRVLEQLLSPLTLSRLHDSELKVSADQDVLTAAELLERLTKAIYSELGELKPGEYTNRKPAVSSLRRNLQRVYLKRLANLAMGQVPVPEDCQTVAHFELVALQGRLKETLSNKDIKLDRYTQAHLNETLERIGKVLDARLTLSKP